MIGQVQEASDEAGIKKGATNFPSSQLSPKQLAPALTVIF